MRSKVLLIALLAFSAVGLTGCPGVVTYTVREHAFTTSNCHWEIVSDGYGTYEQQYCWNPYYGEYRAYYGADRVYVRRYRPGYRGPVRVIYGAPGVIVRPRRYYPAPVVVQPPRRPRPGRYYAINVAREATSVAVNANSISFEGNAFESAEILVQNGAPVSQTTIEVVVAGVNTDSAKALVGELVESRNESRGVLTLGEGVGSDSAYIQRINVMVPAGRRVDVR
jgi:hypothetical protein